MWDTLAKGEVLKLFQFDSQVGGQTVKTLKPRTPKEMATCNSVMRLMAQEKGAETPTERYARMKKDINEWYREMKTWGLTQAEQKVLEEYCLSSYGTPAQQEDMMKILMDKRICGFTLAEANDARKICAKKQMNRIPELHDKILDKATSKTLGEYVWKVIVNIQLGYSFSEIHSLAYSFVGLQTIYLATYFNPVYWNTACLRVDSGLDEDASSNYGKIAKAVGNIINRGIDLSLIDINKSGYMFEPDVENDTILYGMKGLNGVGGEIIQEIIANRPYYSLTDFMEKVKCNNKTQSYVDYFDDILKEMSEVHQRKNADYGNNFHKRYEKYGFLTALLRLTDKMERLENIYEKGEIQVKDESVEDTLLDLANYAVMTIVELKNHKN
jgi:DNA polymerase-3 subunit alpha